MLTLFRLFARSKDARIVKNCELALCALVPADIHIKAKKSSNSSTPKQRTQPGSVSNELREVVPPCNLCVTLTYLLSSTRSTHRQSMCLKEREKKTRGSYSYKLSLRSSFDTHSHCTALHTSIPASPIYYAL